MDITNMRRSGVLTSVVQVISAIVLLSIAASTIAEQPGTPKAILQWDGVYRSELKVSDSIGYWQYFRFYPDGTVITVSTDAMPEKLSSWFSKENTAVGIGKFGISADALSFSIDTGGIIVDYVGEIAGSQIRLRSFSHANKRSGDETYSFLKWNVKLNGLSGGS